MVDPTKTPATPVRTLSPTPGATENKTQGTATPNPAGKPAPQSATAKPAAKPLPRAARPANYSTTPFWIGMSLSVLWVAVVAFVMMQSGGTSTFAGLSLTNWAIGISAIISPVAMIWMVAAYLQRAADVQSVTEPLRRQLAMITGESGAAEVRVRRFNQAVKEQLELLRSTKTIGDAELMAIAERINMHKAEFEQFEQQNVYQINEIQDVIRRSMQHIEKLMDDKFSMLRVLDGKLVQSGEEIARQTHDMRDQIAHLLEEIESHALLTASSVEKALSDSKKLSDTARAQETSLVSAAETASTTLQELSSRIDTNIAHFLNRTGMAREEAEKMAAALDAQTRSLDELSTVLPARISEAEAVLRGVADRLYASEQLAREQAGNLADKLSTQMDNMQSLLDRFAARVGEIDGGLQQRGTDLDGLVFRISGAASDLAAQLDETIDGLGNRAEQSLKRYSSANEEAKRTTDGIVNQLAETAARYEAATHHLGTVSEANAVQLRAISHEIGQQLGQFENLHNATQQAGQEVQARAAQALGNMQTVLERLLSTRDATQTVGEALTEKLRQAADQNERVIARINEAARMSVHALGIATESLGRREGDITAQTQHAESVLRATMVELEQKAFAAQNQLKSQNEAMAALSVDIQDRLDRTDKRLQDFADFAAQPVQQVVDQIDASTAQGRGALEVYGRDMAAQLDRLQDYNGRIGLMGTDVSRMTSETLVAIEELNNRFETVRKAQDEASRSVMEQFNAMSERLRSEVGTLSIKAAEAATTLQEAALQVGQQTHALQGEAQNGEDKIKTIVNALQNEAMQMRSTLDKQALEINAELSRVGNRFTELGEQLKTRTTDAYALLDRVAAHYNDITMAAASEFETRANMLDRTASDTVAKVQSLSASMEGQLSTINDGSRQLESNVTNITVAGDKAIERIELLNARFGSLHTTAVDGTDRAVGRMEEAAHGFKQHHEMLAGAAESSVSVIQKAGAALGEQASRMLDTTHQVETSISGLNASTASFADQSAQVRASMEQHNARLIASLKDSIEQLDTVNARMQQTTASAMSSADKATSRYNELADTASQKIDGSARELFKIADQTESTLGALSASVTQQVAALNIVSEQITAQHKALSESNETQRAELLDLFDKIKGAHTESSDVAERTILRLDETLAKVQKHLGQLSDGSQTALASVTTAGAGFADQAGKLLSHAKEAEEQARTAMTVTASLQEQAKQLRDALHNETESASGMLTALLARLTSGSGEMRELSGTASAALTDLQMGIAKQTANLNETMDTIAQRQQVLTNALESQRETLSGLIARLSNAQDETAAAAERSALRLAEGTQNITKQIETIDARTESSLATIRTATEGFAAESAALSAHATQAEGLTRQLLDNAKLMVKEAETLCATMRTEASRTGETIGDVVGKLDTNAGVLRESGSKAEVALGNLAATIAQQSTAINGNLDQIAVRQTELGSALDIQREMLGSMITRLTLAQDETAAAAERTAARLSDSTGQIIRQMESLDGQTQNALASVRAASSGLGDESVTLSRHTQHAEQQIRDMLATTSGMNNEARKIREDMKSEADQVIEQLRTVMTQMDTTIMQLKQQGSAVGNVLDQSALDLSSMAKNASDMLQKQAENLSGIAAQAEKDMGAVGEQIRENSKLIADASTLTQEHGLNLTETAEKATSKLVDLIAKMAESDRETRAMLEMATGTLATTRTKLESELQTIADLSQKAVEQVMGAGSTLAIQSDALRANLASSESALAQAANLVREETAQIPNLLGRTTKQIEDAAKTFKGQTAEISDAMLKTTDRCIVATGAIRDTMMDEARHLSSVAETAQGTLGQFNEAMVAQVAAIKSSTGNLTEEQKTLVEKASQTITQLSAASDRLGQLRSETVQTTAKLAREFEAIETRAAATTQKLSASGDNLTKQVAMLVAMTEKAEGQMLGASQNFREQLERVRGGVQTQIEDINRGLMQITAQLDRTGTSLRAAMAGTIVEAEKMAGRFDQTSKDMSTQLTDRTARMRVATEEVSKLLGGFGDQIEVLLDRLGLAGDTVKRQETDFVSHLQQAFVHLGSVTERLDSARVLASNVSDAAVSKLAEVGESIDKQMRGVAEGGQKVAGIVQSVAQTYADQAQKVNGTVLDAQQQIIGMTKSIEEMQARTDRMRVTLKLQGDDLMTSLESILDKLNGAGDAMSDAVDGSMQQKAINSLKKFS